MSKSEEKVQPKEDFNADLARKVAESLQNLDEQTRVKKIIKDNKLEFSVKGKLYRVRKATYEEQQTVNHERSRKYNEFLRDDTFQFRKQLIALYKKRDIDIDKMDARLQELNQEQEKVLLRLATVKTEHDVKVLESQVQALRQEQWALTMERTDLLSYSIEDQLTVFTNAYLTYLVLEKMNREAKEWQRVFATFDEFKKCDDNILIANAFENLNYLVFQTDFAS